MKTDLQDLTRAIVDSYRDLGGVNHIGGQVLPSRNAVAEMLAELEELCFPGFSKDTVVRDDNLEQLTGQRIAMLVPLMAGQVARDLAHSLKRSVDDVGLQADAETFAIDILQRIPALRAALSLDVQALLDGDPAARGREEIILAYPGVRAVVGHRMSHAFWTGGVRLLARMMAEDVHSRTGIDIHPGATIGKSFYIDHGTGVVVGETTVIGDHVKLYQGVSLGALSVSRRLQDQKRHPTIEHHVTIYAGATILGGDTTVGHHSVIGGNVWLTKSVPPHSIVEHDAVVRVASKVDRGHDPGT
jgi:serine O-acetyltransferase